MPVFGLADQVDGDHQRVGAVVGDHRHLGGAGEDVDADLAVQRALGLGDEFVAGADDHVGRLAAEQAVGHGGDGLHAAQGHDHVGAGAVEGVEQAGVHATAAERRRAGDDGLHARRLGRGHAHVGRGDVRVAPRRGVAAGHVDRQHALAGHHAGVQFDLEFAQRVALGVGEGADLRDGEVDVAPHLRRHFGGAAVDLLARHHDLALPAVELPGVGAHRVLAPGLDGGQHLGHHLLRGGRLGLGGLARLLQVAGGHGRSEIRLGKRLPGAGERGAGPGARGAAPSAFRVPGAQLARVANSRSLGSAMTRFM